MSVHSYIKVFSSPSSRRAWIEIRNRRPRNQPPAVALLAEGVDRNHEYLLQSGADGVVALLAEGVDRNSISAGIASTRLLSPSSRRAWIEMDQVWDDLDNFLRRPPRGGRG